MAPKGRNNQVSRVYCILNLLSLAPQGLKTSEIHTRLLDRGYGEGIRTIYRDLDMLSDVGFPLTKDSEDSASGTRWKLEGTARVAQYLKLSPRELFALYLARAALAPLSDTPFYNDLSEIFVRIEERMGSKHQEHLKELSDEVHFEPGPKWGLGLDAETLETVRACCAEGHVLSVKYASSSSGKSGRRKLGPHYLYFAKGSLYLVAEDLADQKVKIFSVPRMTDARLSDEAYESEVVQPEDFFKDTFGIFRGGRSAQVRIHFSKRLAGFVRERGWHPTQRLLPKTDGTLVLKLEVGITPELVKWILGFGPDARVIGPKELESMVQGAAEATARQYRKNKAA